LEFLVIPATALGRHGHLPVLLERAGVYQVFYIFPGGAIALAMPPVPCFHAALVQTAYQTLPEGYQFRA
jgi:hypothetical protein